MLTQYIIKFNALDEEYNLGRYYSIITADSAAQAERIAQRRAAKLGFVQSIITQPTTKAIRRKGYWPAVLMRQRL